jgi:hypothetical protein
MATIRMVRGVCGENGKDWLPGTTQECSDYYADYLIGRRAAVRVTPAAAKESDGLDTTTAKASVNRMARAPKTR